MDLKRAIREVLEGQFYIPVIRDLDLSVPAFVGEPWSPNVSANNNNDGGGCDNDGGCASEALIITGASPSSSSSSHLALSNLNSVLSTPRPRQTFWP